MEQAIQILNEMYDRCVDNYRESKSDFDAGRVDALKSAIEALEVQK